MSCTRYSQATLIRESITASFSGALFLAWFRIERETRVTSDEPQETMGRVKKTGGDVWVRGRWMSVRMSTTKLNRLYMHWTSS